MDGNVARRDTLFRWRGLFDRLGGSFQWCDFRRGGLRCRCDGLHCRCDGLHFRRLGPFHNIVWRIEQESVFSQQLAGRPGQLDQHAHERIIDRLRAAHLDIRLAVRAALDLEFELGAIRIFQPGTPIDIRRRKASNQAGFLGLID